jgi:predicted transcriptional regulator
MKKKTHLIALRVDKEVVEELDSFADKHDRNRSQVIREALRRFLGLK